MYSPILWVSNGSMLASYVFSGHVPDFLGPTRTSEWRLKAQETPVWWSSFPQIPRKHVGLGGGNSNIFYVHHLGKMSDLINIFQIDWNHQVENVGPFLKLVEVVGACNSQLRVPLFHGLTSCLMCFCCVKKFVRFWRSKCSFHLPLASRWGRINEVFQLWDGVLRTDGSISRWWVKRKITFLAGWMQYNPGQCGFDGDKVGEVYWSKSDFIQIHPLVVGMLRTQK